MLPVLHAAGPSFFTGSSILRRTAPPSPIDHGSDTLPRNNVVRRGLPREKMIGVIAGSATGFLLICIIVGWMIWPYIREKRAKQKEKVQLLNEKKVSTISPFSSPETGYNWPQELEDTGRPMRRGTLLRKLQQARAQPPQITVRIPDGIMEHIQEEEAVVSPMEKVPPRFGSLASPNMSSARTSRASLSLYDFKPLPPPPKISESPEASRGNLVVVPTIIEIGASTSTLAETESIMEAREGVRRNLAPPPMIRRKPLTIRKPVETPLLKAPNPESPTAMSMLSVQSADPERLSLISEGSADRRTSAFVESELRRLEAAEEKIGERKSLLHELKRVKEQRKRLTQEERELRGKLKEMEPLVPGVKSPGVKSPTTYRDKARRSERAPRRSVDPRSPMIEEVD